MNYLSSDYFTYKNNILHCEEVPVPEIIKTSGTPVYIYSKRFLIDRYNEFSEAVKEIPHTIFYAAKSNFNLSIIKTFVTLGSGVDVNSQGELYRALKAGAAPGKIIMSGVGKTEEEISLALEKNILMIKAESIQEIELINEISSRMKKIAHVAVRVNPDVDPKTHPYISTGLGENKFGIDSGSSLKIFKDYKKYSHIKFTGIDMHLGSQITSIEPFADAVDKLSEIFFKVKDFGLTLEHFDLGGGVGVKYNNEDVFTIREYAAALLPKLKRLNCRVFFEPGRYLNANGGILAAKILYTKTNSALKEKNFFVVDAAMNDLLRPSFYNAYHHIQPVQLNGERKDISADIVGPVCESGDYFAKNRTILECRQGEYLAIMSAGAYSVVMSSNYNARRRPPEVLVKGNKFSIVRSRETYDHMLYDEKAE
ncbi:MAG TPA: diaminopimelate decarboxylase [Ignavibacteriaceae bacterium]|nr:diaminopimelate decarboxylase [Ignavibacteriaceae bacterium]